MDRTSILGDFIERWAPLEALQRVNSLELDARSLSDLSVLSNLTSAGTLRVDRASIENVDGLEGLVEVTRLLITNAPDLSDLAGLQNLTTAEDLQLTNTGLTRLDGLDGLRRVQTLALVDNSNLVDVEALKGLVEAESLTISNNDRLERLVDMPRITALVGLKVESNPQLLEGPQLSGLVDADSGNIRIVDNARLGQVSGLNALQSVDTLEIAGNAALTKVELPALVSATVLSFVCNPQLPVDSLEGIVRSAGPILADLAGNQGSPMACAPMP